MIRALIVALVLALPASARVFGDPLPPEPEFYTVVALPPNYSNNPGCQQIISAFATDPTFIALRKATAVRMYSVLDPDFRNRYKPEDVLPDVWSKGRHALIVVDREGGLVWWLQGGSPEYVAQEIRAKRVLESLKQTENRGQLFRRPRRPQVCTPETCPPNSPGTPTTDTNEPLRPVLPPIDSEPVDVPVPPAPVEPAEPDPAIAAQAEQIKQLQQTILELKQQITIQTQPGISAVELQALKDGVTQILTQINAAKSQADAAKAAAEKPFYIRVVDPRGRYTTEPQQVKLGQQVDLILEPIAKQ